MSAAQPSGQQVYDLAAFNKVWDRAGRLLALLARSFLPDLLCFNWYEAIGLVVFACASVVFSFIDFNHFTDPANNPSVYSVVNDRNADIEPWRRTLMCISGAAAFTGVLSVVMTTKGKISCFVWGAVNSLLYGLFAYAYGYAGDAQLNLFFFLPMQFLGVHLWGEDMLAADQGTAVTVQTARLTIPLWIASLTVATGISFACYYEIPVFAKAISGIYVFEDEELPRQLDSVNTALSVVAQVLSVFRYAEQWYFWLAVDGLQIAMFTGVAGYGIVINVVAMWCLFSINALAGLYAWHARMWEQSAPDQVPLSSPKAAYLSLGSDSKEDDQEAAAAAVARCEDPHMHGNGFGGFLPAVTPTSPPQHEQRRGLCVGKFWPFHAGHALLFSTALQHCDELYIIVCEQPHQYPSGTVRVQCIQESFPTARVMLVRDDCYDPCDSKLWAKLSVVWCGFVPDIVFTSESYGDTWAGYLGCEHMAVDMARKQVPISGTKLRANPCASWQYLPASSRKRYCRRIVLVGSESTGKTTLARALAEHRGTVWVAEYAREVCERQLAEQSNLDDQQSLPEFVWTDDDFADIIAEQAKREDDAAAACPNGVIICDTNCWATLIWYERYMGKPAPVRLQQLCQQVYTPPSVYVLCTVEGSDFVQDGLRDGEHIRDAMEKAFSEALRTQSVPVEIVSGPFQQRQETAMRKLEVYMQ